jgi:Family of unknown function (DUF6763)
MARDLPPIVGNWYKHLDKGQLFRVVDVDEDNDMIEVQHFDGDLEQFESDEWFEMDLARAAEPEDWTGPVDDVERDDLGYAETDMSDRDWRKSLDEEENPKEEWEDERPEDERDEWAEGEPSEEEP